MIDLNTFVPPGSDLTLTEAILITDDGEIAVQAALPNGDQHAVLLIPCDDKHRDGEDCDYSLADVAENLPTPPPMHQSAPTRPSKVWRRSNRFSFPALGSRN